MQNKPFHGRVVYLPRQSENENVRGYAGQNDFHSILVMLSLTLSNKIHDEDRMKLQNQIVTSAEANGRIFMIVLQSKLF